MIVGSIFILGLLFILPAVLFYTFSKSKAPFQLGILFGSIHLFLILLLSVYIYANIKQDGDLVLLFLIAYGLDIPVSLLTIPITGIAEKIIGTSFVLTNFWVPGIVFAIFGTLQYFFIGLGLGKLFKSRFA